MKVAHSSWNAVAIRHINEVYELLAVFLNVKIEEFYEKTVN